MGMMDSSDYLGKAIIFMKDAAYSEDDTIPAPRWHKIVMGFSADEPSIGEVLVSFSIVPDDYRFQVPCEYLNLSDFMDFKEYNVEINILGLRSL